MTKLFLELWKPKDTWRELSLDDREAYVQSIGPSIERLLAQGVELVGIGTVDDDTDQRADYDYWAVWSIPDDEMVDRFEKAVRDDGFYDYFDQINARGAPEGPQSVFGAMMAP